MECWIYQQPTRNAGRLRAEVAICPALFHRRGLQVVLLQVFLETAVLSVT